MSAARARRVLNDWKEAGIVRNWVELSSRPIRFLVQVDGETALTLKPPEIEGINVMVEATIARMRGLGLV